jgi:uncharacterized protein (DUF58 family)
MFRRSGSSFDLKNIREYDPSDDPRRIDWRLEARTGRLFIKEYHEEERDGIVILADVSRSLEVLRTPAARPGPPGPPSSENVAASIAWILSALGIPVLLLAFAGRALRSLDRSRGGIGSRELESFFASLAELERDGTDIGAAIAISRRRSRYKRLVIISDFLDPAFAPARLPFARTFLLQLHRPIEELVGTNGDLEVEDPETGRRLRLPWDKLAEKSHAARRATLDEGLAEAGRGRNFHRRISTGEGLQGALWDFLEALYD